MRARARRVVAKVIGKSADWVVVVVVLSPSAKE